MKTKLFFSPILLLLLFPLSGCSNDNETQNVENPSAFNLQLVSDNSIDVNFTPTLVWEMSSDPNGAAINYDLFVQKTSEVPNGTLPTDLLASNLNSTSFLNIQPLLPNTMYSWYVKAKNTSGAYTNSTSIYNFTTSTIENLPPDPFVLLAPADNTIEVPLDAELIWQATTDSENDPILYDIYFGMDAPNNLVGVDVQQPSFEINNLMPFTNYKWYVVAKDNVGNTQASLTFTFTTKNNTDIADYSLISSNAISVQEGRFGHQMLKYDNKLWILGGSTNFTVGEVNDVWNSDDLGLTWNLVKENTAPPNGFLADNAHQAVVFRNEMWVLVSNAAYKSSDGINWDFVQYTGNSGAGSHYWPRGHHQAVVYHDRLYVIAGGTIPRNDVWSTDGIPNSDGKITWTKNTESAAFQLRIGHQVVVYNDIMYLIGGGISTLRMNDVWSSTDGTNWALVTNDAPFSKRNEHEIVVQSDGEYLWLFGGNGIDPNTNVFTGELNDVWIMDSDNNWTLVKQHNENAITPNVFRGRREFDVLALDDYLYVGMGKYQTTLLNDTWIFNNF